MKRNDLVAWWYPSWGVYRVVRCFNPTKGRPASQWVIEALDGGHLFIADEIDLHLASE